LSVASDEEFPGLNTAGLSLLCAIISQMLARQRSPWHNNLMNTSRTSQIKAKAAQYYAVGIAFFSVIVGIVVTIMVIVNRNS
jgi:hypothetical protein